MMFPSSTRSANRTNLLCWMHHSRRKSSHWIALSGAARRRVVCQKTYREEQRKNVRRGIEPRIGGVGGDNLLRCRILPTGHYHGQQHVRDQELSLQSPVADPESKPHRVSLCRAARRASSRLARFEHAIRSNRPTPPNSTNILSRT